MKFMILALTMAFLSACATTQYRMEWQVDGDNKPELAKFMAASEECKDFAYKARVSGSRYAQWDLHASCLQRKGYTFKNVAL